MNKLGLKAKLGIGFGALLVIVVALGITGYRASVVEDEMSDEVERQVAKREMAVAVDNSVEKQVASMRGFLLTGDDERLKSGAEAQKVLRDAMDKLQGMLQTEKGKQAFANIQRGYGEYRPLMDRAIQLRRDGKAKEAVDLMFASDVTAKRNGLRNEVTTLIGTVDTL
jgi:methyl-accepting chemotaxis protein